MDRWLWRTRVLYVLAFGVASIALAWISGEDTGPASILFWAIAGGLGWAARANARRVEDARLIGSVDPDIWYPVHEALQRGELPADPELDPPLRRLVDDRQRRLGGTKSPTLVAAWAIGVCVTAAFAVESTGWLIIAVGLLVAGPIARHRATTEGRRLDRLEIGLLARAGR